EQGNRDVDVLPQRHMTALAVRRNQRQCHHGDCAVQAVPGCDKKAHNRPRSDVESQDVELHAERDSLESVPDSPKDLRIPQKGYKVHLAVSPNPNGGTPKWLSSRSW